MKIDFLQPSQLPYPGQPILQSQGGTYQPYALPVGGGAFQPAAKDGLFNSIFTPDDLPYPLPVVVQQPQGNSGVAGNATANPGCCYCQPPQQPSGNTSTGATQPAQPSGNGSTGTTQPSGSTSTSATQPANESAPPTVPTTQPGQIIINVGMPAATPSSGATSASLATAQAAAAPTTAASPTTTTPMAVTAAAPSPIAAAPVAAMPILGGGVPRPEVFSRAYSSNPRLRARAPKMQEEVLEQLLGEQITMKMLHATSSPVAFVVPDNCNAVDIFVGAIEVSPEVGSADDLDLVVTTGAYKLSDAQSSDGSLRPGDQITVTIPWRYASWVELAADHLRVPVTARFYRIENE